MDQGGWTLHFDWPFSCEQGGNVNIEAGTTVNLDHYLQVNDTPVAVGNSSEQINFNGRAILLQTPAAGSNWLVLAA